MEDNSVIAVIKFVSGEIIKIKCSGYKHNGKLVVCADEKGRAVFIAPSEQVKCIYEEKHRVIVID